jgi:PAS domain S-box-containing protein
MSPKRAPKSKKKIKKKAKKRSSGGGASRTGAGRKKKSAPRAKKRKSAAKRKAGGSSRGALAEILEAIPDAVCVTDASRRLVLVNDAYARLFGKSPGRLLGRRPEEFLPEDLASSYRDSDEVALGSKRAVRTEEVMDRGGERVLLDSLRVPLFDEKGRGTGLVEICRDVTRQRRVEGELRSTADRLQRVVAEAPVVLFALDEVGFFTMSEGRGLEKLGLVSGEVVGKSALRLYGENKSVIETLERALKGEVFKATMTVGNAEWETQYSPIVDEEGVCRGTIGVAIDVTDRIEAEKSDREHLRKERQLRMEAEAASRSKDEFLALLSHELRTPMTAMLGWAFLLRKGDMTGTEFQGALDAIERNMKAQAQIIEDLLDVSRIVTGKVRIETRPIEAASILQAAVDVVRPAAQARRVGMSIELRDPAAVVLGDPERLQQAIWNLVLNAVKFSNDGGSVRIGLGVENGRVSISVEDDGVGLHPDYLPHVFDPFSQAEASLTREHGGLGLGLAIVRHIIDLHGGTIRAESEGPGKGSRFTVVLPAADGTGEPVEKSHPDRKTLFGEFPDLTGVSVLVVDDEADTRSMLKGVLEYAKAQVILAGNAAEAYALFKSHRPDVMVVDIAMPGEDGHSLLRRIRDLGADKGGGVPAAALTARVAIEDRTAALRAGFQMYLPKPVEPAELVVVIKSLAGDKA